MLQRTFENDQRDRQDEIGLYQPIWKEGMIQDRNPRDTPCSIAFKIY